MKRFIVVFDNEPSETESAPWVPSACSAARLTFVDNDAIATEISENKEARKALLESGVPPGDPKLAPYYKAALEKVAAGQQRLALYSTNWLTYLGQVDGCVLDFSRLEEQRALGISQGVDPKAAEAYVIKFSNQQRNKARKHLAADRILELPSQESAPKKAELVAAFVKKLG